MPYLKHTLGKTFYVAKGSKSKPALVCAHGGPGGTHKNLKHLLKLAKNRKVIVYDQLGGGKSSPSIKKYWNIKTFVKELDLLVTSQKLDKFYLFGNSWGTTLVLEYYFAYPEKVLGIIFQSPLFSTKDWQNDAIALIKKMNKKEKTTLLRSLAHKPVDKKEFEKAMMSYYLKYVLRNKKHLQRMFSSDRKIDTGKQIYEYMWGNSEFHATGTLKKYSRVADLKKVKVPALLICGEHDEATPKTSQKYVKKMPNAHLKVIRGASHVISLEKPVELRRIITKFLG